METLQCDNYHEHQISSKTSLKLQMTLREDYMTPETSCLSDLECCWNDEIDKSNGILMIRSHNKIKILCLIFY